MHTMTNADELPFASLVLLLARPRLLSARVLRIAVNESLGTSFPLDGGDLEEDRFLVGDRPPFALKLDKRLYLVHAFAKPYCLLRQPAYCGLC